MEYPVFVSLSQLSAELEKRGAHGKLRSAIRKAWRVQSCICDLRQAQDSCEILRANMTANVGHDTSASLTIERALLTTAIVLYARATSTSGKGSERGSIQLERGKLTETQWADHCALVSVRNTAIAHVVSSEESGVDIWHRAFLFLRQLSGGRWQPASATQQTGVHVETVRRLERMLPVATTILTERFQQRMTTVVDEMQVAKMDEAELLRCAFDPIETFGSAEAVDALLAPGPGRMATIWSVGGSGAIGN